MDRRAGLPPTKQLMGDMAATATGADSPLPHTFVAGAVDYRGRPVLRSSSGCWRSAYFIIGVEVAERFAYYGISSNLITYLTESLGQSTATAAANVNAWSGTAQLLPLLGAFIADAFWGGYLTIIIASLLYILALGLLALSTLLRSDHDSKTSPKSPPRFRVILFFFSLYLMAFAQGGHKPNVQAFGANQFDSENSQESKAKGSFFNWWFFGLCIGPLLGIFVIAYIQDNLSWALGFGIPCVVMGFALVVFLFGSMTYRFGVKTKEKNAFVRIGQVFVKAARNWQTTPSAISDHQGSHQLRFLNKALISTDGSMEDGTVCTLDEVEEAKSVLRLVPIWASCLAYAIVYAQSSTLFTKQGATMDRSIGSSFKIPAATLLSFIPLTIIILIPIYDTILVPLTSAMTKKPSGITMLQRVGTGIFISIIAMVVAGLVESKRLRTAGALIPMKIWWIVPQYLLYGAGEVFTVVGLQEFFYDQMPSDLKSIGIALYLSVIGTGSFLSSFLISIVQKTTGGNGWISDNLNQGHLDYFYYLLAGISLGAFVMYIFVAKSYVYREKIRREIHFS